MELSPGSVVQLNAILSIHLGNGIHQACPQSEVHLPKTSPVLEGLLGKWCRESAVDLLPLPCFCSLLSSLAERQITEFLPHWHCQALTVVFLCIVLLVNWFKCYGNYIYLFFDPVNSKQAGCFPPLFEGRTYSESDAININKRSKNRYLQWSSVVLKSIKYQKFPNPAGAFLNHHPLLLVGHSYTFWHKPQSQASLINDAWQRSVKQTKGEAAFDGSTYSSRPLLLCDR